MRNNRRGFYLFLLFVPFACLVFSGCASLELRSDCRSCSIVIDGKYTDWEGAGSYYNEKEKVLVSLLNDKDYLYICLITRNRQMEVRMMESGFTVWFDPEGKKNKVLGIRFPVGLKRMGMAVDEEKRDPTMDWQDQEDKSGLVDRERERLRDRDLNKRLETLENLEGKLEIIIGPLAIKGKHTKPPAEEGKKEGSPGEKKEDRPGGPFGHHNHPAELSLEEAAKLGIEARIGHENHYFVYELKVPLVKSGEHPYAIEVKAGSPVGLGLEISMPGADMPESAGNKPMPPAGMGLAGPPQEAEFKLWAIVTLSPKQ